MIVIVAGRVDDDARALAAAFPAGAARVLTSRDLSRPGWRLRTDSPAEDCLVAGGRRLRAARITGVVTLLPCVVPAELVQIVASDRDYVAAEMTAFLLYWLSGLRCPMLNRPTPGCLTGPSWRAEQWRRLARSQRIPVGSLRRTTAAPAAPAQRRPIRSLTVLGSRVVESHLPSLHAAARTLAAAAGVSMLQTFFRIGPHGPQFAGATTRPDLSSPHVRQAIADFFVGGAA